MCACFAGEGWGSLDLKQGPLICKVSMLTPYIPRLHINFNYSTHLEIQPSLRSQGQVIIMDH